MDEPMERLVRSLKDDLDAATAERDRLRFFVEDVQKVLDDAAYASGFRTEEWAPALTLMQELVSAEVRAIELTESGRADEVDRGLQWRRERRAKLERDAREGT